MTSKTTTIRRTTGLSYVQPQFHPNYTAMLRDANDDFVYRHDAISPDGIRMTKGNSTYTIAVVASGKRFTVQTWHERGHSIHGTPTSSDVALAAVARLMASRLARGYSVPPPRRS